MGLLLHIKCDAQALQVTDEHLLDWEVVLFGQQPIDIGLSLQHCWEKLRVAPQNQPHLELMA